MAHAYSAVMNGRDIFRFLDIPKELVDRRILITIDPIEESVFDTASKLQKLFADAPSIKIPKKVQIDSLMEEMNDALS